jgi:hypothetical protein
VWVPVLRSGALEPAARREGRRISDSRVSRFYDATGRLANAYSGVIQLPRGVPAWDVYFVFSPAVRWPAGLGRDAPPPPTYWMHQIGKYGPAELYLNPELFARVVSGLLGTIRKEHQDVGQAGEPQSVRTPGGQAGLGGSRHLHGLFTGGLLRAVILRPLFKIQVTQDEHPPRDLLRRPTVTECSSLHCATMAAR